MTHNPRFPFSEVIDLSRYGGSGEVTTASAVLEHLAPRLTPERWAKVQKVVALRTNDVAVCLEGIYDRGNASAVMRTAEAMGFLNVHLIELNERFKESSRVTAGADKWLEVRKHQSTREGVMALKRNGYRVLATHLDDRATPLEQQDLTQPLAIVFGNEKDGISQEMAEAADATVILPMRGFVQSYNISVAAAIAFETIRSARERAGIKESISPTEQRILAAHYCLRTLDNSARLLKEVIQRG